ncbi:MAG: hypothetical protein DMG96_43295 [Acidobacteria bacterium]|nr:MAG: hypothetical protein DMG96_43295 [Acidobacteriota bacterium]
MTKKTTTFAFSVIVMLNLSVPTLLAQGAPSAKVHNKSTAPVARMQASHEKPCWEVAGISKSAIAERSRIEQETRSQVQSVCNDSSLNEQQKREKHQPAAARGTESLSEGTSCGQRRKRRSRCRGNPSRRRALWRDDSAKAIRTRATMNK